MSSTSIARYLNPWKFKRDQAERMVALRQRDGDICRRCRRPMRFDLPAGHDQAPKFEHVQAENAGDELATLCLCHVRCNSGMVDHTPEVLERMRRKSEAELFAKSRRKKRKAA